MSLRKGLQPFVGLFAVLAFAVCILFAISENGAVAAMGAETQEQTMPAEDGKAEEASPDTLEEVESGFTELQKALDAARQSETPEEAVERTNAILERLAEQQSQRRSMSAELQAQLRNAVHAAQDVARQADEENPEWKTEFHEKLQPAQDAMDKAVAHAQDAQGFAALVIVGIFAFFFFLLLFMAAPEIGCLIIVLAVCAIIVCLLVL